MGKTNFTSLVSGLLFAALMIFGVNSANAQCNPPVGLTVVSMTTTTVTLQWTSVNPPSVDHCWNIEVYAATGLCFAGSSVYTETICTFPQNGNGAATLVGPDTYQFTVTGLAPGTAYAWSLVETCDAAQGNSGFCFNALGPPFQTFDDPFVVAPGLITPPDCPVVSPGYVPNGDFDVVITDGLSCPSPQAQYFVTVTPIAGTEPGGGNPQPGAGFVGVIGPVPSGTYNFGLLGAGQWNVNVLQIGCNQMPVNNPVNIIVTVPDGVDALDPTWQIADVIGNVLADNNPFTIPGTTFNAGNVTIPEGSCSYQQQLYATGFDNCDGIIQAPNAVQIVSNTTVPATINPATQASVTPDNFGVYLLDINWSIGTTTLVVDMRDAQGNNPDLTLIANVLDNVNPSLTFTGLGNVTVPVCADSRDVTFTVTIDDLCDQDVSAPTVTVNGGAALAGVQVAPTVWQYTITVTPAMDGQIVQAVYTDDSGNGGSTLITLDVEQAGQDFPPVVDIPGNLNYTVPACQDDELLIIGFQINDDCQAVDPTQLVFNDGGAGFDLLNPVIVQNDPYTAYVEFFGNVGPGGYLMSVTYPGAGTIDFPVNVTQAAPQAPEIVMPGNLNFTIPICQPDLETTFAITILDECDDPINPANAAFSVLCGGGPAVPLNGVFLGNGYFEFLETIDPTWNGCLLIASYTDGDGLTTTVDALLTVTDQPDQWAPIIVYPSNNIEVELDPCEPGPAIIVFEATATDNCDGDLPVNVNFAPGVAGINLLPSLGGQEYEVMAFPGVYVVSLDATDAAGNTREENFQIVVTQDPAPQTNLGCNDNINVTLNDDCQAVIVPDMVLEGNFGCLVDADFQIVVQDGNPANGNIVDGCGDFIYEISLATPAPIIGFTGAFAPGNWTAFSSGAGGTITHTANQLELTSGNGNAADDVSVAIAMPADGTVSFDYNYLIENQFVSDIFLVDINGNIVVNISGGATIPNTGSGTLNEVVQAGWVLMIAIDGDGFTTGGVTSVVDISNFQFQFAVQAQNPGDFTTCWGYIHSEDKTDPIIQCPASTDEAIVDQEFQEIPGSLDATDDTFQPGLYACWLELFNPQDGDHFYETCTFTVTQEDVYTIDLYAPLTDPIGGPNFNLGWIGGLFQNGFNADTPCENVISQNDNQIFIDQIAAGVVGGFNGAPALLIQDDGEPIWRITLPLKPGSSYTLVTTSAQANAEGDFVWRIYSDGNGQAVGNCVTPVQQTQEVRTLICDDIDYIDIDNLDDVIPRCYRTDRDGNIIFPPNFIERQRIEALIDWLERTGLPTVSDNCGNIEVCVSDEVEPNGDCGDVILTRTFSIKDKQGNYVTDSPCDGPPNTAECVQIITFRKPTMADVVLPPYTVFLECDEGFATDDEGNPDPSVSGFPFVISAFGIHDLDQTYCNLGASYSDYPRVDVCENTYKLRREWNVFDWCNPGNNYTYNQTIKVGDFSNPEVSCPIVDWDHDGIPDHVLTYSTGPFDCTAAFAVPAPTITDNCSSTATIYPSVVTFVTGPELDIYGNPIPGTSVTEEVLVAELDPVEVDLANIPSTVGFVSGIPLGCHYFRYKVVDACEKETTIDCLFFVEDQVEPVAICDDDFNISIGGQGFARIYAEDIDEGSWDNCGPIRIEARRLYNEDPNTCAPVPPFYSPWGEYVDFNCCDVHDMVTIELRVWDDRNGDGIPGNTIPRVGCDGTVELVTDNSNICWLEVLVEDKINPFCIPPHNVVTDCTDIPYDFDPFNTDQLQELFGEAEATDNCPGATWEELTPIVNLHDCGFGTIIRRFRATDEWGNVSTNSCQQVITIREVHNYEICFPKDAEANCGDPNPDTIIYNEIACDLLAVSIDDEEFSASGDECYKIFRTYRVINWCEYDGESDPIVIGRDEDCDGFPGDEQVCVLVRPVPNTQGETFTYIDRDQNENNLNPIQFTKSPVCDGLTNPTGYWIDEAMAANIGRDIESVGYWQYTQIIKVYDNIDPIITAGAFDPFCSLDNVDCDGPVDIPFSVDENCTPDDITVKVFLDAFGDGVIDFEVQISNTGVVSGDTNVFTVSGTYPNYNITSAGLPIGSHIFDVHVEDGCGNVGATEIPFDVVDCKAPVPTCINGLAIELMPTEPGTDADGDGDEDTGAMAVWAIDFIASPNSDCSEPIKYSINRAGDTPDMNQTGIVLTCDDPETLIVEIYAWDSAFNPYAVQPDGTVGGPNYDFCETYILVQDNMFDVCADVPGNGSIAGTIATELTDGVEGVNVQLSGDQAMTDVTPTDGTYAFANIPLNSDVSVTPELDINPLNGVSTFDLVLISKHILGVQALDSPYKIIAADVNNSQSVTTLDLIHARKVILAVDDAFPNNTSWRFVDASYTFPNPANPFAEAFPEVISINDLSGNLTGEDFVAVKIGDVNGNAVANAFADVDERNSGDVFAFDLADEAVRSGNEYSVSFTSSDLAKVQGYQLTLNFDAAALNLTDVEYGVATEDNFGMRFVEEGVITMSWNGEASADEVLFSLVFQATADAQLSELLSVSSRYTQAEAYNTSGEVMEVALNFNSGVIAGGQFELYQNQPNPFKGETLIGFNLPEAADVTIKIHDVNGRTLRLIRDGFAKGYNAITVNSAELPAVGVLYYTVETADFTATKKMIIVE